jgi:hypothetical protein
MRTMAVALAALLGLALTLAPPVSQAATILVPPLTITKLNHQGFPHGASDTITIPGTGYTSSGFSATIATGDVVVVRIQPPPGKKFVVHPPLDPIGGTFRFNIYWQAAGGTISSQEPHSLIFENLQGVSPIQTYSNVVLGDQREIVLVEKEYRFFAGFEFTAIVVAITEAQSLPPVTQAFGDVKSYTDPSFGASGSTLGPQVPIMEIVDAGVVSTQRASWGRLKALYR